VRIVYITSAAVLGGLLLLYPVMALTSSGGAPPTYSGGPADSGTCQTCHWEFEVNEGSGSVTVDAPATYEPGVSYVFTVTVDNTTEPEGDAPIQGFQLSVQDAEGNHIGDLLLNDAANTLYAGGDFNYVTHSLAGRFETTWTVEWISPQVENAPELVTVYVAGNASNANGNVSGDYIYTASSAMALKGTSTQPLAVPGAFTLTSVYPNPARGVSTVEVSLDKALTVTVRVYDGLGRVVQTVDAGHLPVGTHDVRLNVDGYAPGLYFIEVYTGEGSLVRPVTVIG
jgi:hypothetical protein